MTIITGPLFSLTASGTLAAAILLQPPPPSSPAARTVARRAPTRLARTIKIIRNPTPAQAIARAALTAAIDYARSPQPAHLPIIHAIAAARALPFFHAAAAFAYATNATPGHTAWDDGATDWDAAATVWD